MNGGPASSRRSYNITLYDLIGRIAFIQSKKSRIKEVSEILRTALKIKAKINRKITDLGHA